jgi:purine-binding chemotaxis protein CheW
VFSLQKNFALELKDVQEIIEDEEVLAIPGDSGFHSGVIYLRGKIVPVVDLRKFFDFPERRAEGDEKQKLIICSGHGWTVALQVDSIVTIHKQEKYHATPSLHPRLADKKDTLDRLIEFEGENGSVEHVLVVNVYSLVRNHLESGEDGS